MTDFQLPSDNRDWTLEDGSKVFPNMDPWYRTDYNWDASLLNEFFTGPSSAYDLEKRVNDPRTCLCATLAVVTGDDYKAEEKFREVFEELHETAAEKFTDEIIARTTRRRRYYLAQEEDLELETAMAVSQEEGLLESDLLESDDSSLKADSATKSGFERCRSDLKATAIGAGLLVREAILDKVRKSMVQLRFFAKEHEVDEWVSAPDYKNRSNNGTTVGDRLCGAVHIEKMAHEGGKKKPSITIRTNGSLPKRGSSESMTAITKTMLGHQFEMLGAFEDTDPREGNLQWYKKTHFLAIQHIVQTYLGSSIGVEPKKESALSLEPIFFRFPPKQERRLDLQRSLKMIMQLPAVMTMMFGPLSASVAYLVARERQLKTKELMRMMGLLDISSLASWLIWFLCMNIVVCIPLACFYGWFLFPATGKIVLYALMLCFANATVTFGLVVSTLVTKETYAALVALGLYFGTAFLKQALDEHSSWSYQMLMSFFFPSVAFARVQESLSNFELLGVDNGVSNVFMRWNGNFSAGGGICMLVLNFWANMLLYYYLDQVVWWHGVGAPRPLWFFVLPSYWQEVLGLQKDPLPASGEDLIANPNDRQHREPEDDERLRQMRVENRCASVTNLSKSFRDATGTTVHAVKNISFTMYQDECFCLLGHNGAGKTTTMMMITGCLPQTSGDIQIKGHSIPQDIRAVRTSMGFCPQHNILWDELTCEEHLQLFGRINGMTKAHLAAKGRELLRAVALYDKIKSRVSALSGGMKRKLCCTLAFLHEPLLVILDEPSAGMDPFARRGMWDTLKAWRTGHIICLTTHYMDEAEALADRLAIMHSGEVACSGSSMFLKNAFGCGYIISFVKSQDGDLVDKQIVDFVSRYVSGLKVQSSIGKELLLAVPFREANGFPALFMALDEAKANLAVESYGISVTNLEEVYMQVAHQYDNKRHKRLSSRARLSFSTPSAPLADPEAGSGGEAAQPPLLETILQALLMFLVQFLALLMRRCKYTFRNPSAMCCQIFFPVACLSTFCLITAGWTTLSFAKILLSTNNWNVDIGSGPKVPIVVGAHENALWPLDEQEKIWEDFDKTNDIGLSAQFATIETSSSKCYGSDCFLYETSAFMDACWNDTDKDTEASHYGAIYYPKNGVARGTEPRTVIFQNLTATHSPPIMLKLHAEAYVGEYDLYNHPFAPPSGKASTNSESAGLQGLLLITTAIAAFAFIPAGTTGFIVLEKENEVKNMLLISGCQVSAYWWSNLVFDTLLAMIPGLMALLLFVIFKDHGGAPFAESPGFQATLALVMVFALAASAFSYMASFCFSKAATAMVAMWLIGIAVGIVGMVVGQIVGIMTLTFGDTMENATLPMIRVIWDMVCKLNPVYAFGTGIFKIFINMSMLFAYGMQEKTSIGPLSGHYLTLFGEPECPPTEHLPPAQREQWEWSKDLFFSGCRSMVGDEFIVMIASSFFLMAAVMVLDILCNTPALAKMFNGSDDMQPADTGDDMVKTEIYRVEGLDPDSQLVYVYNLHKKFKHVHAVRGISFAASEGQVFGLLGVNGAGKTTTFKMLCSEISPTCGEVRIRGHNVTTNASAARKNIGYCPQFNALLESMTPTEHLYLFGRIKGMKGPALKDAVDTIVTEMDLTSFLGSRSGQLSGGNKRKVNVGMATIGEPPMVFLDEPSAGMDPVARRGMWSVIQDIAEKRKKSVVILTTHSMEEADALCSRIAIQVDGQFRCLGSSQQIKTKYGQGLEINLRFKTPSHEEVVAGLAELGVAEDGPIDAYSGGAFQRLYGDRVVAELQKRQGSPLAQGAGSAPTIGALVEWGILALRCLELEDFMLEQFGAAVASYEIAGKAIVPLEKTQNVVRYQLHDSVLKGRFRSIGGLFALFQDHQAKYFIEDFQVNQTSLEQIFNRFASQQASQLVMRGAVIAPLPWAVVAPLPQQIPQPYGVAPVAPAAPSIELNRIPAAPQPAGAQFQGASQPLLQAAPGSAPVSSTPMSSMPVASTPPVSSTPPPVSSTPPPVSLTPPPVSSTPPPVSSTPPPVSSTPPPVSSTPAQASAPPSSFTEPQSSAPSSTPPQGWTPKA